MTAYPDRDSDNTVFQMRNLLSGALSSSIYAFTEEKHKARTAWTRGSEVTKLAAHFKGTKNQAVVEQAAHEIIEQHGKSGNFYNPGESVKHLATGLVEAKYSLSPVVSETMAWAMSDLYDVPFLAKAFCGSPGHLSNAINTEKLKGWAEGVIRDHATDVGRLQQSQHNMNPHDHSPLKLNADYFQSLFSTYQYLQGSPTQDHMLQSVGGAVWTYMERFAKAGGPERLAVIARVADENRLFGLANTIRENVARYQSYYASAAPAAFEMP